MKQTVDGGDYFIIVFIAIIFIGGAIAVYKFMKAGKK